MLFYFANFIPPSLLHRLCPLNTICGREKGTRGAGQQNKHVEHAHKQRQFCQQAKGPAMYLDDKSPQHKARPPSS